MQVDSLHDALVQAQQDQPKQMALPLRRLSEIRHSSQVEILRLTILRHGLKPASMEMRQARIEVAAAVAMFRRRRRLSLIGD
jgi:hypothetical protein